MSLLDALSAPWPWYVAGAIAGLTVPALLLLGNKSFGISSSLRHVCAACFPGNVKFFRYEWKKEIWNLFFVAGILLGGVLATNFLSSSASIQIDQRTISDLQNLGIHSFNGMMPADLFSIESLFTWRGVVLFVVGGFLVGFGTRYAGGCTSGHTIMGLSNLQWPSLVATIFFMVGGFLMTHVFLPLIMQL